jgi:predicted transcriptional regulator
MLCVGNFLPTYQGVIKLVHVVKEIKEIRQREVSLNDAKEEIYRYLLPNPDS